MTAFRTLAIAVFLSGCMMPTTQENSTSVPVFFTGMTLLQEVDCGGFDIQYYAHPEVSLRELSEVMSDRGYGYVVIPKPGSGISKVSSRHMNAPKFGENYSIFYRPENEGVREITGNGLDGHRAPDEAYLEDAPLFNDKGVFPVQVRYADIFAENTTGGYGAGELTIDDRIARVFNADDGSTCILKPPKIVVRIKP